MGYGGAESHDDVGMVVLCLVMMWDMVVLSLMIMWGMVVLCLMIICRQP